MSTFSERLNQAISESGITKYRLAKIVGIDRSSITFYCQGKYEAKADILHRIAIALNVSEAWLIGIQGAEKTRLEKLSRETSELVRLYKLMDDVNKQKLISYARGLIDGKL